MSQKKQLMAESTTLSDRLSTKDHFEVCKNLKPLNNEQLIELGTALGLDFVNLKRMKDLPGDMVHAWLNGMDNVTEKSGWPSWTSLINALENISQGGVASIIREEREIIFNNSVSSTIPLPISSPNEHLEETSMLATPSPPPVPNVSRSPSEGMTMTVISKLATPPPSSSLFSASTTQPSTVSNDNSTAQESASKMCKEHEEPLEIYWCSCCDFTIINHPHHKYELDKAAPETKKKLIYQLEPLKEMKANFSHAVKEVQVTKSEIMAQGDFVVNEIKKSCEELVTIIENRTQELLREAEMKKMQKLKNLSDQEEELSATCAVIGNVIEHTQQSVVEQSTEEKIVCTQAEHEKQIKKEIEKYCMKALDPVEDVDIGVEVSFADDLKQLCQTKAKMIQLPIDPAKCIVSGDGMKTVEINKMAELFLKTKLTNGESTKRECAIECHLKSLVNGSTIKCMVDQIGGNQYRIQYTPVIRGQHELTVTVNEQEVAGSPFPIFVSIHPSKLGKPVRVIQSQHKPLCIAVTSVGEAIITGRCSIEVFDRNGGSMRSMNPSDYGLNRAVGVAVDNTNNIYIADHKSIVKLSGDMNLLTIIHSKLNSSHFRGIAVVGDEVIVITL